MNAVIVYEEYGVGRKASALLQRASERAGAATAWSVKPWRLDMLQWAVLAGQAHQDAAEAQLIVLAFSGKAEVPARLLEWLEQWALHRQVQEAALALFDGRDGDTLSTTATPALGEFAKRNGLSFICEDVEPSEPKPRDLRVDLHEREVAQTAVMAGILGRVPCEGYQHWGINE